VTKTLPLNFKLKHYGSVLVQQTRIIPQNCTVAVYGGTVSSIERQLNRKTMIALCKQPILLQFLLPTFNAERCSEFPLLLKRGIVIYLWRLPSKYYENVIASFLRTKTIMHHIYIYIYIHTYICAVLKRLMTPSDFHIPFPSIVPFAH
jgi:hypothetical protein